jgi:5'-methylthioadenosine phosphorylase
MTVQIGIIGGSGLYDIDELTEREEIRLSTPFGEPSGPYVTATLRGRRVAFLARHGVGHTITPTELNFRANIFGFKLLGVERIFSASAVGSLKERYSPLDVVIPDQFFDRTRARISTFFGGGIVVHVSFAHPVCPDLSRISFEVARTVGAHIGRRAHMGGTYVCMEGPQFSTLAESKLYQSWGMDVIGMTNLQEAKLAREAEICYSTIALVTDYDCWHPDHENVTVDMIVSNLTTNVDMAKRIIAEAVGRVPVERGCACGGALSTAIITSPAAIPEEIKTELAPLIGKYVK